MLLRLLYLALRFSLGVTQCKQNYLGPHWVLKSGSSLGCDRQLFASNSAKSIRTQMLWKEISVLPEAPFDDRRLHLRHCGDFVDNLYLVAK